MNSQFRCQNEERRRLVGATEDDQGNPILPKLNGIDYLEVATADQRTLKIFFLHNLPGEVNPVPPGPKLTRANVVIEGGARVRDIRIDSATASNNVLTVTVSESGDFSTYTLRIVSSPTHSEPPSGFDPQLSAVAFSFKVECPSDFDCEQPTVCPPQKLIEPEINYLAKDYSSFRRLILDRMSTLMPNWRERSPADLQIALVEMLAYVGDHLSYFQDAIATEAYLGTSRRRVSVRRHARLLDYFVHDGTNARTWVAFEVTAGRAADKTNLRERTKVLTRGSTAQIAVATVDAVKALAERPVVFETMHDITLNSAHNRIAFYTWSDRECCLPKGSTRATLADTGLSLKAGDVLIFEEVLSPTTGTEADADPSHGHAVRLISAVKSVDPLDGTAVVEIEWHVQDALPFPLCLTARVADNTGTPVVKEVSVARGNIALADHGQTLTGEQLVPPAVPDTGHYRPHLRFADITFRVPYDDQRARLDPAFGALDQDVRHALPRVSLNDGHEDWAAQRDLLNSDRFAAEFVVEMERDGSARLRFGDGETAGKKPDKGRTFRASYRVGNGGAGNVGAGAITRIVSDLPGFERVRNPRPARGGTDPETMEQVRQFAPQAFRTQQRAVTEADWAEVAERHAEVQKAAATFRWFGSWYTVLVTIDRRGGLAVKGDEQFRREMENHLGQFRIAGYDMEINDPVLVPLDISLTVCVKSGYFRSDVKQRLLSSFSRYDLPGGGRGFFHPDNFTFGQPVYLSKIYQTAMEVTGVASVEAIQFKRWGKPANKELETGALAPASLEIIQLDNDPNFPENGRIAFDMNGGL